MAQPTSDRGGHDAERDSAESVDQERCTDRPVPSGHVWLITGAQASGKSTVADLLAKRFDPSVHVRGGQFYRWAVNGWSHFDAVDTGAARRHLELRYRLSAEAASEYAAAGFTTVVQDNIYGIDIDAWIARVRAERVHLVVLRPTVETLAHRERERQLRTGNAAYSRSFRPIDNDAAVASISSTLGAWIDTTSLSPDQTVTEILQRADEAWVPQ